MKLVRFRASKLHGFLEFDIKFNDDLTFLTGINGSGKTTALNSIVALITPDLLVLANLEFKNISVEIEHNNDRLSISAESDKDFVHLSLSNSKEILTFPKYIIDNDMPPGRQNESEAEFYREFIASKIDHPVIKLISSLPTPMFLGLDRRARFDEELRRNRYVARSARTSRNIFGSSLSRSLSDAADLAETRYRDALIASGQIAERLQQEMLLNLITVEPREEEDFESLIIPSAADRREIERVRRDLETLAHILHLPTIEVNQRVAPFLDLLERLASKIPANTDINQLLQRDSRHSEVLSSVFQWSTNQTHLKRIKVISETVSKYTKQRFDLLKPTTKYLELIDKFLRDSGKKVSFNDRGYISVQIEGIVDEKSITSLSSGEAQIFVILTQLAFHPLAQKNNVFIIDEPELSLHVQWQELFVDSVRSANPNIQYVLATHAPSIILDRVDNCFDISKLKR